MIKDFKAYFDQIKILDLQDVTEHTLRPALDQLFPLVPKLYFGTQILAQALPGHLNFFLPTLPPVVAPLPCPDTLIRSRSQTTNEYLCHSERSTAE
jgi:hypothetical protein